MCLIRCDAKGNTLEFSASTESRVKDAAAFRAVDDAPPHDLGRRRLRDVLAAEPHVPRLGPDEPREHTERRRLPGAVGADEGDDLAVAHPERDALEGADLP